MEEGEEEEEEEKREEEGKGEEGGKRGERVGLGTSWREARTEKEEMEALRREGEWRVRAGSAKVERWLDGVEFDG